MKPRYISKSELKDILLFLFENHNGPGKPLMENISEKDKLNAVESLTEQLVAGGRPINIHDLKNPRFEQSLAIALVSIVSLDKKFDMTKWRDEIKQVILANDPKLTETLLLKLKPEIKEAYKGLLLELTYAKLAKPTPGNKRLDDPEEKAEIEASIEKNADELANGFVNPANKYMNMTGLLEEVTGSIAVPVLVFLGAPGFIPWNPNSETSTAPIESLDKISDTQGGDPLGLNHAAATRYLQGGAQPNLLERVLDAGVVSSIPKPTP